MGGCQAPAKKAKTVAGGSKRRNDGGVAGRPKDRKAGSGTKTAGNNAPGGKVVKVTAENGALCSVSGLLCPDMHAVLRNARALRNKNIRHLARAKANILFNLAGLHQRRQHDKGLCMPRGRTFQPLHALAPEWAREPCPSLASLQRMSVEFHTLHFSRATSTTPQTHTQATTRRKGVRARPDRCSSKQLRPRTTMRVLKNTLKRTAASCRTASGSSPRAAFAICASSTCRC